MAVLRIMDFKGIGKKQYDDVCAKIKFPEEQPRGLIFHTAGSTKDGACVVDCWESQEAFDRFFKDKLQPAFLQLGLPQPDVQSISPYRVFTGQTLAGRR